MSGLTIEKSLKGRRVFQWLFSDKKYYAHLFKFALPIALQSLITSSLNMVGVVMIGQLGAAPVAAVGLANQIFFLLNIIIFGISSGSSIFTAQLWGKRDVPNIRKVLGLALTLGLIAATVFLILAVFLPAQVLSIYTEDREVIALGSDYLRIIGLGFLFYAITYSVSATMRSTGDVHTPLFVTMAALSLNTVLSYVLILGKLGFPVMGVTGAGIAVLISRAVECSVLLFFAYRKGSPAAGKLREIFSYDLTFARKVLKPVLPVLMNETLWSLGITTYNIVYARIGTDSIAAINIASSIDMMAFVLFIGIGNACAIMVGNRIGEGDHDRAFHYGALTLIIGFLGGVLIGAIILLSADSLLTLYKVNSNVIYAARRILTLLGLLIWLRGSNMILFIGIMRSGGDTRLALLLDGVIIWVVGVPSAMIGAFVFHLPVYWVYLLVMSEEFLKWSFAIQRFVSRKWIHNVAQTVQS